MKNASRWLAIMTGLLAIRCGGGPAAPVVGVDLGAGDGSTLAAGRGETISAEPVHLYVTWPAGSKLTDLPDEYAHDVLSRLEAAAGGALVIHRQQIGSPMIRMRVDDSTLDQDNARGLSWWTGPCSGDVAIESSATADPLILLHELGHILIAGPHSPHSEDVMAPGGTFRQVRPFTFSVREIGILRANLANGCTRIESWQ